MAKAEIDLPDDFDEEEKEAIITGLQNKAEKVSSCSWHMVTSLLLTQASAPMCLSLLHCHHICHSVTIVSLHTHGLLYTSVCLWFTATTSATVFAKHAQPSAQHSTPSKVQP